MKSWSRRKNILALAYPNTEYCGVYSLGLRIISNQVNSKENWFTTLHYTDKNNLKAENFIGFSFQYEPDYLNFFNMLKENNIPLEKEKRQQIIFAGGPCINQNPFTLKKYLDFMVLGDSEVVIPKILEVYERTESKEEFLNEISKIIGVFIPDLNEPTYAVLNNLDEVPYPIKQEYPENLDKNFVFGKALLLEIERGCPYRCKFCVIPTTYPKIRYRSYEKLIRIIDEGIKLNKADKVAIYAASFTHPKRADFLNYMLKKGIKFIVPSTKVEFLNEEIMKLIKENGQTSLTIAPEADEITRRAVNKFTSDNRFFEFAKLAKKLNFKKIKMYLLYGIPNQEINDLGKTIDFIKKMKEIFPNIYPSINPVVPKPKTQFDGLPFNKKILKQQAKFLKKELNKLNIDYKIESIRTAYNEYLLANTKDLTPDFFRSF
ncbi:radical SAM protein [Candidatus Woesearchaeota archaeon]|nr:radical SAM protein [Candidatus Woesearchaeota archaeon]